MGCLLKSFTIFPPRMVSQVQIILRDNRHNASHAICTELYFQF